MFTAAAVAILVTMLLAMLRALLDPTVYDRILVVNTLGTKTVLIIAVFGFPTERPRLFGHCLDLRPHQLHRYHRNTQVFRVR